MLTLDIKHPEAEDFTTIKQDLSKVTGANVSLLLNDEFMQAVQNDELFVHRFPVDAKLSDILPDAIENLEHNQILEGKQEGSYYKIVKAQELWQTIIAAAHKSAEPGLIFWDRQHVYSPSSVYPEFENISTNPSMAA